MNSASIAVDNRPHGSEKHPAIGATGANSEFLPALTQRRSKYVRRLGNSDVI
jgi:hypothetical protein